MEYEGDSKFRRRQLSERWCDDDDDYSLWSNECPCC